MTVVPQATTGFDDDQVEPHRAGWQWVATGQAADVAKGKPGAMQASALAAINGFLREAVVAPAAPAHLHDHERNRRSGIDGHNVQLRPTHVDVPSEHVPAERFEMAGDQRLRCIA